MTDYKREDSRFSAASLLRQTFGLMRGNAILVLVALATMAALGIAYDLGVGGEALYLPLTILNLVMQYWLTVTLLDRLGLRVAHRPRFPAFVLLGIITTLGIILGLILLIVPGIVLAVRWSAATPAVIAREDRVFDAIAYSWRETDGGFWPIFVTHLVVYAPLAVAMLGLAAIEASGSILLPATILVELALNGSLIAGWHAGVAIYAATEPQLAVTEVFA
jgi:hypothetical protein